MQPSKLTSNLLQGWQAHYTDKCCIRLAPLVYNTNESSRFGWLLQREISEFAERKRKQIMSSNEASWKENIKQQLEQELEKRVRDALLTPPPASSLPTATSSSSMPPRPVLYDLELSDLTPKERKHLAAEQWNSMKTRRRMREIVSGAEAAGGGSLRSAKSRSVATPMPTFFFNDCLSRSNQDSFPGVFGLYSQYEQQDRVNARIFVDFDRLSDNEKRRYYRAFTNAGYQEALRSGRQADGTLLTDPIDGYMDRLGIAHGRHGPFWPADYGPVCATPKHKRATCPDESALFFTKSVESSQQTVDSQLTQYTTRWRGVQTVYDANRSNKDFEPPPVSAGHAPSIIFESRFESGNLQQARRVGEFEYELLLRPDLYTKRHTQWFYFRLQGVLPGITYKFRILNLLKRDSLYNHGLRPLLYSEYSAETHNTSWMRVGHHINYTRNITNLQSSLLHREMAYYLLEWQMEFPNADDTCYLAHCYPYTYTDLKNDLDDLLAQPTRSEVMRRDVLCETRVGNSCFLVTVTDYSASQAEMSKKKGVVVTGRVHPGESNSSWMMLGLITFITGDSLVAKTLRQRFIFKIVPMLNPDGVIVGNYRCSLSARDMNRNYRHPRRENFPTIWHTKALMEEFGKEREIIVYCDLHGHSRKHNVFMYGCNRSNQNNDVNSAEAVLRERLFPWLMAQKAPDKFSFRGCKFQIKRCKEATGRVVIFRQLSILNSFTMEATFCGTTICKGENRHFNTYDFQQVGQVFSEAVLDYIDIEEDKTKQADVFTQLSHCMMQQVLTKQGLLPPHLPDITTETGRQQMNEYLATGVTLTLEQLNSELVLMIKAVVDQQIPRPLPSADTTSVSEVVPTVDADVAVTTLANEKSSCVFTRAVVQLECVQLLEELNVVEAVEESDSSDTDSESDPEMKALEPRTKKKKKKKKHKKHQHLRGSHDNQMESASRKQKENRVSNSVLPAISDGGSPKRKKDQNEMKNFIVESINKRKHDRQFTRSNTLYVSKYQGRSNGGIPCFSEERSHERSLKRMDELRKRLQEEDEKKQEQHVSSESAILSPRMHLHETLAQINNRSNHLSLFQQTSALPVQVNYVHGMSNFPAYDIPPANRPQHISDESSDSDFFESTEQSPGEEQGHLPMLDSLKPQHRLLTVGITSSQPSLRQLQRSSWPRKNSLPTSRAERAFSFEVGPASHRHVTTSLVMTHGDTGADTPSTAVPKRKLPSTGTLRSAKLQDITPSDTAVIPTSALMTPMSTPMLMSREYTQLLLNSLRSHRALNSGDSVPSQSTSQALLAKSAVQGNFATDL